MKRKASAVWTGGLKDGKGVVSTGSKTLDKTPYNFNMRFGEEAGTNPEELVAAAHAGCFAMAFSAILGESKIKPASISAKAVVTLEQVDGGFAVTSSALDVVAKVPGGDAEKVKAAGAAAKAGCPISKLLNCKVTMKLKVEV
ncbi:MAG: OsmC family protein [Nitrospirae bacterium]|nr:OsmC family protein [Nitrospirota bacterium]